MLQNNFMKIFSFSGSFRKNETILKEFGYVEVVVQLSTSARPLWGGGCKYMMSDIFWEEVKI